jgi:hypothetical protein
VKKNEGNADDTKNSRKSYHTNKEDLMARIAKLLTVMMVAVFLVMIPLRPAFSAVMGQEEEVSAEKMMADLLVARPLGFVSMVVGSAFFVVSLPFSAVGGNVDEASQKMVKDPAKFTFQRPLGQF